MTNGRLHASRRSSGSLPSEAHTLARPHTTQLIPRCFVSRSRSYIRSEGFTYTKTGTVEQFDNCREDILEIPAIGEVTYTPEFGALRAFLEAKAKPVINMDVRPNTALEPRWRALRWTLAAYSTTQSNRRYAVSSKAPVDVTLPVALPTLSFNFLSTA